MPNYVLLVALVLLTACSRAPQLQQDTDEYQRRLGRVLNTEFAESPPPAPLAYPARNLLLHDIPSLSVELSDFYTMQQCDLATLIAQRNTAVGKTQPLSQRMVYESALLDGLNRCAERLQNASPELTRQLKGIADTKRQHWAWLWRNLIQTSEETRLAFSLSEEFIDADNNRDAQASIQALQQLAKLQIPGKLSEQALESALATLRSSRLPARLWRTQTYIATSLNTLTPTLTPLLERISCADGKASEQAKILRNVFYLFFIEKIQPVGSKINQLHYQLMPVWQQWKDNDTLAPAFRDYIQRNGMDGFTRYQQAVKAHVRIWQTFLGRCNLAPVVPTHR